MSYKTYENYKKSKTDFFGLLPNHWDEIKIKHFANIFGRIGFRGYTASDLVGEGEGAITLGPPNIENHKLLLDNKKYLSWDKYEESPEIKIFNGDILLVKTASVGKVALVENLNEPTTINPQLVVFKNIKINKKYLYYALISDSIQQQISSNLKGGVISTLTQEEILNYIIPLPSKKEQIKIVNFLDKKTNEIDININKNKELILLLEEKKVALINQVVTKGLDINAPMKDSGIEWICEIPEHWECRKINTLSSVSRGASPRPIDDPIYFDENGVYSWVRISNVTSSNKYLEKTDEKLSSLGKSLSVPIEPGHVFVSIAGTVGKPIIANIKCCIHDGFVYFKNLKINDGFLFYIFEGKESYKGLGKMGTQLNLNTETIGRIYIPVPPKNEQIAIEDYLDAELLKLNQTIQKTQQNIDLLEEYKTSLIHHAVTGKIDVRDEV